MRALAAFLLLGACGPAVTQPVASAPAAPSTAAVHTPAPGEWAAWSFPHKKAYMEQVVVVDAKKMFAGYDPVRYRDVTCKTCHGASADDGSYRMPNPALPALVPAKIIELAQTHPDAFIFMDGAVVPHVAKLLGKSTFDHFTMSGFGCFACHTAAR